MYWIRLVVDYSAGEAAIEAERFGEVRDRKSLFVKTESRREIIT